MLTFKPVNDKCLDCSKPIDPKTARQEIVFDDKSQCRRRCGDCIKKPTLVKITNAT